MTGKLNDSIKLAEGALGALCLRNRRMARICPRVGLLARMSGSLDQVDRENSVNVDFPVSKAH